MLSKPLRSLSIAAALALACGAPAWAGVSQVGSTLILTGESVPGDDVDIFDVFVASNGDVTTFGVVGAADGTVFTGITDILIDTGLGGDDTVRMQVESASINVDIDTGVFGSDTVEIELTTPPGAALAAVSFKIDMGQRQDNLNFNVESFAEDLTLDLTFDGAEQPKLELAQSAGRAVINLAGRLGDVIAGGGADFTLNGLVDNGPFGGSDTKIEVNGNLTSDLTVRAARFGSIDLIVNGDLAGSPQLVESPGIKVEVNGNATGDAFLHGTPFGASLEYVVKGDLDGSPLVRGRGFPDSIKLQVEGAILGGTPTADGGGGFPDSCDVSPGVTVVGC